MAIDQKARYAYILEYYDSQAEMIRRYQLLYFLADDTIEMHDIKNRRIFLKRCQYDGIKLSDFFVGSIVNIYSRNLTVVEYADEFTRSANVKNHQRTLAMIKPDAFKNAGSIISAINNAGFRIANMKVFSLSRTEAEEFYSVHRNREFFDGLVDFMQQKPIMALELVKSNAILDWRAFMGPTNSNTARQNAPKSIRARYGTDGRMNAVHGSDSAENAIKEINFFFGTGHKFTSTAQFSDSASSCCLIKPHAFKENITGEILQEILNNKNFAIGALQLFSLSKENAADMLEVYKGVISEYVAMVDELSSGPLIAIEIIAKGTDKQHGVNQFRDFVGPFDPQIAKILRPNTLRAKFGINKIRNAIHCTDLPEDGNLEVEYFFHLLQ